MAIYTLIDHTADIGIEIQARTKKGLFCRAALAMSHLMTGVPATHASGGREESIHVEGADTEDLLVNFLREILYLQNSRGLVLCDCRIEKGGRRRLAAVICFEPAQRRPQLEIKAVTYHGLRVSKEKSGWAARVIFDI